MKTNVFFAQNKKANFLQIPKLNSRITFIPNASNTESKILQLLGIGSRIRTDSTSSHSKRIENPTLNKFDSVKLTATHHEKKSPCQSFNLKITSDELYSFFEKYDKLTPLQKSIFKRICWYVRSNPSAFPTQTKIAKGKGIECSRKHVNETFRLFKSYGWLSLQSRGFKRSKLAFVPHCILQIDVFKREYFKRIEVTSQVTHTYSTYKKITSRKTGTLQIPFYLQKLNISLDAKLKLSLVPQSIYQSALESAKSDAHKGKKFLNEERYLVGVALRMAQKQGMRLDWRAYYGTIVA